MLGNALKTATCSLVLINCATSWKNSFLRVQLKDHFWMYLNFFNRVNFCCSLFSLLLDIHHFPMPATTHNLWSAHNDHWRQFYCRWLWSQCNSFWSADQPGRKLLGPMPVDSHKSCFHFNTVVFRLGLQQPETGHANLPCKNHIKVRGKPENLNIVTI